MSIKNEINNNDVNSAYVNLKNSSLLNNKNATSTQSIKTESVYKPNDYSKKASSSAKVKTQSITTLIKSFALVASAVILGEVGISTLSPPTVEVRQMQVEAYETGVYYFVEFSDFTEDLTIVLQNDFTNRVDKVEEQFVDGGFENLAPNMKYTFLIKQGSKIVAKQTIITRTREEDYENPDKPYEEDYSGRDPTTGDDYSNNDNSTTNDYPNGIDNAGEGNGTSNDNGNSSTNGN